MKEIRVGVAGAGFIGPVHIEALRRLPHVKVVSICHHEKAQEKALELGVEKGYDTFDAQLQNDTLDVVHICTPNFLHYKMVRKALLAGKHVVCEKPLSLTSEQAKNLLSLAVQRGLLHAVHFNIRYYPLVQQMRALRTSGELGEVFSIVGSYLQDWLFLQTDYNWRLEPSKSGDSRAIADIGSHLLDVIEYISDLKITSVFADLNTVHKTRKKPLKSVETYSGKLLKPNDYEEVPINTEDFATVLLRFDNGNKGSITVSQVAAGRKNRLSLEISGSKKTFAWNSENPNTLWIGNRESGNTQLLRDPALAQPQAAAIMAYPGGHNEGFADTSKQLFKVVYDALKQWDPKKVPYYPTFEDGLREMLLCEAILQSHQEQRWVSIP